MIQVKVLDASGAQLAFDEHPNHIRLVLYRAYEAGDVICVQCEAGQFLHMQFAAGIAPAEVYLPDGQMRWQVPCGDERLVYPPHVFDGPKQIIEIKTVPPERLGEVRNLALNPLDLRGEQSFYPHATANVETRGESVFAARNVIDGMTWNHGHGSWPFESWGIGARTDAWCQVDFGREVKVERMALILRADFPHDAYWVNGHVVLSDGAEIAFDLEKSDQPQYIDLTGHTVTWMRLERMQKSDDPSAFPSLTEWEIFGTEVADETLADD